ncbi:50S ribosomal protein L29 [Alphaproteobacteria bacterium]|nr:50S ribosomal protein L29 [Alphaproteobacteria bacterium]
MNATIKNTDIKKIKSEISTLKKSLLNFKFQKSSGQLEKTSEIRKTKKKLARLKTEINKSIGVSNA